MQRRVTSDLRFVDTISVTHYSIIFIIDTIDRGLTTKYIHPYTFFSSTQITLTLALSYDTHLQDNIHASTRPERSTLTLTQT